MPLPMVHLAVAVRTFVLEMASTLYRNRINKNGYSAIWVHGGGGGTIEDNDLRDNERGAWNIAAGSKRKVKRARNLE